MKKIIFICFISFFVDVFADVKSKLLINVSLFPVGSFEIESKVFKGGKIK